MVKWALTHVPPSSQPTILEIGSGNGTLLFALAEAGYVTASLTGIDYSTDAIKLAKAIAAKRGIGGITFVKRDFLKDELPSGPWDLILDKGTYDAIALSPKDENSHSPAASYPVQLTRHMKTGSYFLITSCNFTEEELQTIFAVPETGMVYNSRIQHAVYAYGGKSGSICASVAFRNSI